MLYGYKKSSLGKNLSQYLLIGVWLIMALVALAHNKFNRLKYCNQKPPLIFKDIIEFRLLSNKSRKFLPLEFAT